ncbi:hypothetical protein [Vibrio ulleungensis]|uniref:Uncharacterized protein n=1 Tax=Vibrio ulleungensis TaxID=2807619 RepID=A0ABS2HJB2_9VIBR|nr:hypothetical protein [Vibrio ulleungensis]MBM7037605.1 hypothetical protein [Vibrio ulleungensis]
MAKKLCKYRKEVVAQLSEIESLVSQPQFACKSCARVANSAENLCSAVPMGMALESPVSLVAANHTFEIEHDAVQHFTPPSAPELTVLNSKKTPKTSKKQAKKLKKLRKQVAKSAKKLAKAQRRLDKKGGTPQARPTPDQANPATMARLH